MDAEMTPRERILAAFRGKEPDRVPVVVFGVNPYDPDSWTRRDPSFAPVLEAVREKSDVFYIIGIPTGFIGSDPRVVNYTREEKRVAGSIYIEECINTPRGVLRATHRIDDGVRTSWHQKKFCETFEDVERLMSIDFLPYDPDLTGFRAARKRLGDRGVMHVTFADALLAACGLLTFELVSIMAVEGPETFTRLLDWIAARLLACYRRILEKGELADTVIRLGGCEHATPPLMGPELFAKYVTPYEQRFVRFFHEYGCVVQLHCHGKIGRVLDQMILIAPDGIDPLEPPPDGDISLREVRRRVGSRICLLGNIEFRDLEMATPEEIDMKCRDAIMTGTKGGNFILYPTAPPISSLSPRLQRNYLAFIEAGWRYGREFKH